MKNVTVRAIVYVGVTALGIALFLLTLFCLGPHSENGFYEHHLYWPYITLMQDPYTYNENGPYMRSYSAYVDPDKKCVCLCFTIEGKEQIENPDETIVMSINGEHCKVYRAPFSQLKSAGDAIEEYCRQVKDGSYVYTFSSTEDGLSLSVICPMEGIFKDPGDLNTMTIGFDGIYDSEGNPITRDEGHSDWIFYADRNGRIVPESSLIDVDTEELRSVSEGGDARIVLSTAGKDIEFIGTDEDSHYFQSLQNEFSVEGLDADAEWGMETDENGREVLVITLKNVRNITTDTPKIHIPGGLAFGWEEGMHRSSGEIDRSCIIDNKEDRYGHAED